MRGDIIPTTPWAQGGINPVPGSPTTGATYLTTLTTGLMEAAAQYGTTANSAVINQLLKTITEYCIELESGGILQWSAGTTYRSGAVVIGSDNKTYQALSSQSGNDPTTSPTNWRSFGSGTLTISGTGGAWTSGTGGIVVQWGQAPLNTTPLTFPIAFPTACMSLISTYQGTSAESVSWNIVAQIISTTQYALWEEGGGTNNVFWIAVGY